MAWLRSPTAVLGHAVFLLLAALLGSELLAGNRGPEGEYPAALAVCAAGHPAYTCLAWLRWRIDGGGHTPTPAEPRAAPSLPAIGLPGEAGGSDGAVVPSATPSSFLVRGESDAGRSGSAGTDAGA